MITFRRQRIVSPCAGSTQVMWKVSWIGAAISIGIPSFYKI